MSSLVTIDFEASCLPRDGRSYPIEVGIADMAGWSRSWLIRPEAPWKDWTWKAEAAALHGIDREQLDREGLPVAVVMAELNACIAGREVVADHDLDRVWLAILSDAAGIRPAFRIRHVAELLDQWRPSSDMLQRAIEGADRSSLARHRAAPDALWLARLVGGLRADHLAAHPLFRWSDAAIGAPALQNAA
jgi:hypothetical protein